MDDAAVAAVTLVTRRAAAFPHCLETQEALRLDEHFIPLSGAPCCRSLVFSIDRSSSVGVVFPGQRSQPSGSCVAPANSSPAESPRGTGRKSLALKWGADSSVLWFYNTIQYNTIPCNLKSRVPSKWQPAPRMHRSVEKKKKSQSSSNRDSSETREARFSGLFKISFTLNYYSDFEIRRGHFKSIF